MSYRQARRGSSGDHQITISLDLSGIRYNAKRSEEELQRILDTFKVTVKPTIDLTEIDDLKSTLKQLEKESIHLSLNDEQILQTAKNLANNIGVIFSKAFKQKLSVDAFGEVVASARMLRTAMKEAQEALDKTRISLDHMEEVGKSSSIGNFNNINKRIKELKDTLNELDGADGTGFEKIKNQAAKLSTVVEDISEKLEEHPIRFKATFDVDKIKADINAKKRQLTSELEEQGLTGFDFYVHPKLPKDYSVTMEASIDPIQSAKKIRAQIGTINALLRKKGKKIVLPVSAKEIKEQFSKIPIEVTFSGNFEEKIASIKKELAELKKDASSIKVGSVANSTTQKITVKTEPSENEQAMLAGLNAIYEETKNIVSGINDLKSEGIKLDEKSLAAKTAEVNASKQAAKSTASETAEEKKKLATLNKVRSLYIAAYKEQEKYAGDKNSAAYKNASINVRNLETEWQNRLNALTEEERVERQNILDIEKAQIEARQNNIRLLAQEKAQRKAETDYTKSIAAAERMNKTIQNMNSNMDLMKSRLNDPAKDINFIEYKQAADQFSAAYAQIRAVKSKDGSGNFIDLSQDLKDLEELRTKAEKVYGTIKESVSNTANVAKDADKLNQIYSDITSYMNKYGAELKKNTELYQRFITLQNKMANGAIGYFDAKKQFADIRMEAKRLGVEVDSLWKKMQRAFQARGRGLLSNEGWMLISMSMRDVVRNVIDLDTAMTELKKVTSATAAEYDRFLENAAVRAKDVGASLVDTVKSTSDWARLGYSIDEASDLADSALVYLNVGDDVDNIDDATKSLISTLQAFNIEASDSMSIVDKMNQVANTMPTSAGDIGEGLLRSASAMAAANNTLDETIALFTAGQAVVQNAESLGTILKTTSMRIRGKFKIAVAHYEEIRRPLTQYKIAA